jgi:hypothetical protein
VPIAKYFVVAGSVLAALLLIAGWSLPELPESFPDRPEVIDRATIRIRSAHKWPDKVVLDTNQPTIPPPSIETARPEPSVGLIPGEVMDQTRVDSLARLNSDMRPIDAHRPAAQIKRKAAKAVRSAHLARVRSSNDLQSLGEECCWFEGTGRRATLRAASRDRVARRDLWTSWHIPEAN